MTGSEAFISHLAAHPLRCPDDITARLEAAVTCVPVSVDGNNNSSDTGVGMQMATPCAVTHCELADTTTQLRNLIDKMHCLNPGAHHTPQHC